MTDGLHHCPPEGCRTCEEEDAIYDRPTPTIIDPDTVYDCYLPNGTAVLLGGLEMRMYGATLTRPTSWREWQETLEATSWRRSTRMRAVMDLLAPTSDQDAPPASIADVVGVGDPGIYGRILEDWRLLCGAWNGQVGDDLLGGYASLDYVKDRVDFRQQQE